MYVYMYGEYNRGFGLCNVYKLYLYICMIEKTNQNSQRDTREFEKHKISQWLP